LNTYEVKFNTAGGDFELRYDRKTKELKSVYFYGSIFMSSISPSYNDSMTIDNIYESRALLLSSMYVVGNKKNIALNQDVDDTSNISNYPKILDDLEYRSEVAKDFDKLIASNKSETNIDCSLENEKYRIYYKFDLKSDKYFSNGHITFSIYLN
jgi:hypothetical protein